MTQAGERLTDDGTDGHPAEGLALSALDSPEVLDERLSLIAAAREAPLKLGTFTDEELAALDDLTVRPAQPSPWYGSLSEDHKQIALTAAVRGLTARGVYRADPVDPADRTFTAHLEPTLAALLTMRRFVPHLIVAERTTADFVDWTMLYPQRAGVFLAEYIDRRGIHAFELADTVATVASLGQWAGAFDAPRPDLDVTVPRARIEARPAQLEPITQTLVATTLTRLEPQAAEQETWSSVYTGPAGSYLAVPVDHSHDDAVRYQGIDVAGLRAHLRKVFA